MARVAPQHLTSCSDEVFVQRLRDMDTEELLETIGSLQEEMGQEQRHFNQLSQRIGKLEGSDPVVHEQLSTELMQSQTRLTHLMSRNMQCFTQQTENENKALREGCTSDSNTPLLASAATGEIIATPVIKPEMGIDKNITNVSPESHQVVPHLKNGNQTNLNTDSADLPDQMVPSMLNGKDNACDPASKNNNQVASQFSESAVYTNGHQQLHHFDCEVPNGVAEDLQSQQQQQNSNLNHRITNGHGDDNQDMFNSETTRSGSTPVTVSSQLPTKSHSDDDVDVITTKISPVAITRELYQKNDRASSKTSDTVSAVKGQNHVALDSNVASQRVSISHNITLNHSPPSVFPQRDVVDESVKPETVVSQSGSTTGASTKPASAPAPWSTRTYASKTFSLSTENKKDNTVSNDTTISLSQPDIVKQSIPPTQVKLNDPKVESVVTGAAAQSDTENTASDPPAAWKIKLRSTKTGPAVMAAGTHNDTIDEPAADVVTTVTSETKTVTMRKQRSVPQTTFTMRSGSARPTSYYDGESEGKKEGSRTLAQVFRQSRTFFENACEQETDIKKTEMKKRSASMMNLPSEQQTNNKLTIVASSSHTTSLSQGYIQDVRTASAQVVPSVNSQQAPAQNGTSSGSSHTGSPASHQMNGSSRVSKASSKSSEGEVNEEMMQSIRGAGEAGGDGMPPPVLPESQGFTADDKIQERVTLLNWDPTPLIQDLYAVKLAPEPNQSCAYINMEGYMEKLPTNKRKATLLKTWKRRYFQAKEGNLIYYESVDGENENNTEHRSGQAEKTGVVFTLVGGAVEDLNNGMLGLDDGRGRYLVVKPPTEKEFDDWKRALESQTVGDHTAQYVRPVLKSSPHPQKKVVVIDLGSCSVRAGVLGHTASLPQVFFPTVVATDKGTGKRVIGTEALSPRVRANSNISYPVRPSARVDKHCIDIEVMPDLFQKVFTELDIDPAKHLVMLSAPGNLSDKMKEQIMDILIKQFRVPGVNIVSQVLLALYSYGATSGIVVDIGERLEIVPITDGYIVEQGMTRQPYGGHKVTEMLNGSLTERRYRFFTDVAFQLVRLGMEKLCYVSQSYDQELKLFQKAPQQFRKTLDLKKYDLPEGTWTQISNDLGRFRSPEGLFNLEMWGMDNPPLQKLIQKAVQVCPMDTRREMWRCIYLSGGVTLMPGFPERLHRELTKLVPASITVQVHALPQRYHSAYIGACTLAAMNVFQQSCISAEEWNKTGAPVLRKWHLY